MSGVWAVTPRAPGILSAAATPNRSIGVAGFALRIMFSRHLLREWRSRRGTADDRIGGKYGRFSGIRRLQGMGRYVRVWGVRSY